MSLKHILDSVDIEEGKDMIQAWKDQLALQENKGFAKGEELGFSKGEEFGFSKGEEKQKIEISKNLYKENASISFIAKVTNSSEDIVIKWLEL